LVGEQGLLGLVEEEDGMVLMVEEAEGAVRVVCPNAQSEINESAAIATKVARMVAAWPNRIGVGRSF
jgi:hypothetical protein